MAADLLRAEALPRLPRGIGAALSLGLPLVALVAVQAVSPVAQRLPTGPARFDLAASWLAVQPGALTGAAWAPATAGRVQLGLLLHAVQALQAGTVIAAASFVLVALAVVQAVLLWLLLRRIGCGRAAAGLATAALGIAPAAVGAHATVSVAGIAAVWLLAAALLATRRTTASSVLAGAAAALAVASFPLALLPAAVVAARRGAPVRPLLVGAGAAAGALLALAAVLAVLPGGVAATQLSGVVGAQPLVAGGARSLVAWAVADPLGLLVALVALTASLRSSRSLAVSAGLLAIAAVWPAGGDPAGPLLLLLTVAAVATGLIAQRAVVALLEPVFRRSLVGSGWLTGVAALLLVGVVIALVGLPQALPRSDRSVVLAQRWLAGSVPAGQVVLVGLGTWPDLAARSRAEVGWYAGRSGAVPSSMPWRDAGYVVADASLTRAGGSAAAVLDRSAVVARFGEGADELTVRAVRGGGSAAAPAPSASPSPSPRPTPTAPTSAAERRAAETRLSAGRQLAANPRIELTGSDRALLTAGDVDARIALVLAQLATAHRITVASFGVQRGDSSGIRTTVLISEVDGDRVPADLARTGDLLRFLSALRGDFAARSIDETERGVTASFTPDPAWEPSS